MSTEYGMISYNLHLQSSIEIFNDIKLSKN